MKTAKSQNEHYRDEMTNSGIYHISTSRLEGINNKIKVLKRVAYDSRDLDYFFLRIRSAFRRKFTLSEDWIEEPSDEYFYIQIRASTDSQKPQKC